MPEIEKKIKKKRLVAGLRESHTAPNKAMKVIRRTTLAAGPAPPGQRRRRSDREIADS